MREGMKGVDSEGFYPLIMVTCSSCGCLFLALWLAKSLTFRFLFLLLLPTRSIFHLLTPCLSTPFFLSTPASFSVFLS